MEDKKLTSAESLELISRMINNTRENLSVGSGNMFLLWGYLSVVASLGVYAGMLFNGSQQWNWVWFLIPLIGTPTMIYFQRKEDKKVITYMDTVTSKIWVIEGAVSMVSLMAVSGFIMGVWSLVLPVTMIIIFIATALTLAVIKENVLAVLPCLGIVCGMYILSSLVKNGTLFATDILIFAACFVIGMIIPGHIINSKAKKQCSKN
ncbi:MAG: hypothetical protein PHD21_07100 [Flavobacteriales bacterium]|nr:hypothetical protein [Flavobacteriales bacterium]